jgi:hypothetical protein
MSAPGVSVTAALLHVAPYMAMYVWSAHSRQPYTQALPQE